ncbi:MAG TPA: hypothetical protein VF042_09145 [Gemmatimonadaceae bacterium]
MIKPKLRVLFAFSILLAACSPETPTTFDTDGLGTRAQSGPSDAATPVSFTIVPNEIVGGGPGSATGKVTVSSVTNFDRTLQVSSNNPAVLPFLSSLTVVAAGTDFAAVHLLPSAVSTPTVVTIFVTGGGATVSADLLVDPAGTPPPAPTLSSFTVSPSTVSAGTTATGTVTLPAPAGTDGVVVSLSSRIPASASMPATVTVPPGATMVRFPIATFAGFPNSTTSVLLVASNVNTFISSSVTVVTGGTTSQPSALSSPTLLSPSSDARFSRGSTVTFDWSDVANAVSYTIQIASRDNFSSLVTTQTVSSSGTSISGLPTQRMWWRVRANSSEGTSSAWSGARRFELK